MAPLIKPDFSEAVLPLQPGSHKARIIEVEVKVSQKGSQYLRLKMETYGNDQEPRQNGKLFFHNCMISGKGSGNLRDLLVAVGAMQADSSTYLGEFNTEKLIGAEVKVLMVPGKNSDGSPSQYPEVKKVEPLDQV